jgi:peptidoglycan/LPS O-acetylase OafA/YrhL
MKHRPEIDGLKALAVVPLILFHAGFELFSGGFVGVDVFFVISGYLITTILIEDIENKRFSIVNFYERRARRILPALFLVLLVCIPFTWMWMLPSQMKDFSQSLLAVSLFASNILFWRETSYFDAGMEEMPLQHTWSLAVGEQYYVLFPILLILTWRFGKNKVFWMVVVMAAISLLLSEWGWRKHPNANFYLAITRVWELFAGSITAFIVQKQGLQKNNFFALIGLLAIIFSIFAYNERTPFPSVYALVPIVGAILLVIYADKETITAKLLSTKTFVGIGLISYSAYLWHQPLFAFARIRMLEYPSSLLMLSLSVLSLFFAYFSWRYIEKPFRKSAQLSQKRIFQFSSIGIIIFLVMGLIGSSLNGKLTKTTYPPYPPNISYESLNHRISNEGLPCKRSSKIDVSNAYIGCVFGNRDAVDNVVLLGDSHSAALSYELERWANTHGKRVTWLKMNGCHNFPNVVKNRKAPRVDCVKNHNELTNFISTLNADVILTIRWTHRMYPIDGVKLTMPYRNSFGDVEDSTYREYYVYNSGNFDSSYQAKQDSLRNYVLSIADAASTLFLIHPVPETAINIFKRNFRHWQFKDEVLADVFINEEDYQNRNKFVNQTFEELSKGNIIHIRPGKLFCEESKCYLQKNTIPLYLDDDHLSDSGALLIINEIDNAYR